MRALHNLIQLHLTSITSAMTELPDRITVTDTKNWDLDVSFVGIGFNPIHPSYHFIQCLGLVF